MPQDRSGTNGAAPAVGRGNRAERWSLLAFALLAYVPLLLTDIGRTAADTKSYLYLDPSRMLSRAVSMWDPHLGLGTTTHQNIGYLFPMGPFFWCTERLLHLPSWVAQRLWLGTLLLLAGLGARYLLRTLGVRGPGLTVAMLAYAFTPYALQYSSRLSVLLSPWVALPWLIAFTARALAKPGWRYPALLAITVQLAGGVNASSLFFSLLGPIIYTFHALLVTRDTDLRRVGAALWRTAVLLAATSVWWLSGLWVEGRYGLNVLQYTETVQDVSRTLFPFELLRGLGYWMFYGRDPAGAWNDAAALLARNPFVVLCTLLVPAAALLAGAVLRWRHRFLFVALIVSGLVIGVAAAPYDDPSFAGRVFKAFAAGSSLGLALRSTARATPLVALGVAALLGAGVSAWCARLERRSRPILARALAFAVAGLLLVNATGLWTGSYLTDYLEHREVPKYWRDALAVVDARGEGTRFVSIPGADFAAYAWGDTIDPIEPGLVDRPFVTRELVPWGSGPGASLVAAYDSAIQNGDLEPEAIGPVAGYMNAGDIVVRYDMESGRYSTVPAPQLARRLRAATGRGIDAPILFGDPSSVRALRSSSEATRRTSFPVVGIAGVPGATPIVRAQSTAVPLLVAGDGRAIIDLAGAGLLDPARPLRYAADLVGDPAALRSLPEDAVIVLTDTNRRRGERGAFGFRYGYTEATGESPLVPDIHDQRLDVFPGTGDASRTVTRLDGVRSVRASSYGSSFGYTPEERPAAAFDGNVTTAWTAETSDRRPRLAVTLDAPITTDHIGVAPLVAKVRYPTKVGLRFDGGPPIVRRLADPRTAPLGQLLRFPARRFQRLELEVLETRSRARVDPASSRAQVGFTEIAITDSAPGARTARLTQTQRVPTDLVRALGSRTATHPFVVLLTRESTMDRYGMRRAFTTPTPRRFRIDGQARLSTRAGDAAVDALLGIPGADAGGVTVDSSQRSGDLRHRASTALDGDPATWWVAVVGPKQRPQLEVTLPAPTTVDHLDLQLRTGRDLAAPTRLTVTNGTESRTVDLGAPVPGPLRTASIRAEFAPLTGTNLTVRIDSARPSGRRDGMAPVVEVRELGLPGARVAAVPAAFPDRCTTGLVAVDGRDLPVRLTGSPSAAIAERPVAVEPCGEAADLALAGGSHDVVASDPLAGIPDARAVAMTRITLASAADGAPLEPTALLAAVRGADAPPATTVTEHGPTHISVRVAPAAEPSWLVLGQNINDGWHATVDGRDLGTPTLIDGFANGWRLPAHADPATVELRWTPQRTVDIALWLSALAGLVCLGIIVTTRRRPIDAVPGDARDVQPAVEGFGLRSSRGGPGVSPRAGLICALAIGGLAVVLTRPWIGIVVLAATLLAARDLRLRALVRLAPAAIIVAVGIGIATTILLGDVTPGIDWPGEFALASGPTWIAVFLVLAECTLSAVEDAAVGRQGLEP